MNVRISEQIYEHFLWNSSTEPNVLPLVYVQPTTATFFLQYICTASTEIITIC
jgi:hypothetical protein